MVIERLQHDTYVTDVVTGQVSENHDTGRSGLFEKARKGQKEIDETLSPNKTLLRGTGTIRDRIVASVKRLNVCREADAYARERKMIKQEQKYAQQVLITTGGKKYGELPRQW